MKHLLNPGTILGVLVGAVWKMKPRLQVWIYLRPIKVDIVLS